MVTAAGRLCCNVHMYMIDRQGVINMSVVWFCFVIAWSLAYDVVNH
jgi:hypothetical protein